jgi:hypothetical protein
MIFWTCTLSAHGSGLKASPKASPDDTAKHVFVFAIERSHAQEAAANFFGADPWLITAEISDHEVADAIMGDRAAIVASIRSERRA